MNWTEGKLARHFRSRQSNKQSVLRQKEHFAKARAGQLPNTANQSPPSFSSFFQPARAHASHGFALFSPPRPSDRILSSPRRRSAAEKRPYSALFSRDHESWALPVPVQSSGTSHDEIRHQPHIPATNFDDKGVYEKRRRLLRDHDWAGIRMQKPIPLTFNESSDGRRWSRRQGTAGTKQRQVLGSRPGQTRNDNRHTARPRHQGIKITLGSQQVRLGHPSSIGLGTRVSGSQTVMTVGGDSPVAYPGVPLRGSFVPSSSSVADPREQLSGHIQLASQRDSSTDLISDSGRGRPVEHSHEGLRAPIPIRHFPNLKSSLTSQIDPGEADSVLAQVGAQSPPVLADRMEENEAWRRWIAPIESTGGSGSLNQVQPSVSPGISARNLPAFSPSTSQDEPSVYITGDSSTSGQESTSCVSRRLEDLSSLPEGSFGADDSHSDRVNQSSINSDSAATSHVLCTPGDPSYLWDGHSSSSPAADSPDQYLAGVHDLALEVVSQHLSRRNDDAGSGAASGGSIENVAVEATDLPSKRTDSRSQERADDPAAGQVTQKDSNEMWFQFVYSDTNTEDLHKQVLADAQEESVRDSRALGAGGGSNKADQSGWSFNVSTAATVGQPSIGPTDVEDGFTSAPETCTRHAAPGSPVRTLTSDSLFHEWDDSTGSPYAAPSTHAESSHLSPSAICPGSNDGISVGCDTVPESSGVASNPASLAVEPPQSVANHANARESFIFAPPKPFVGRLAEPAPTRRANTAIRPVTMAKQSRLGRSKHRTRDGRVDIRSIPRYEDDPIEDFDEAEVEPRVQPSLFGCLEIQ